MSRFNQYFIEMGYNYELKLRNPFIYWISNNDTFNFLKKSCYTFGLVLNLIVLMFYRLDQGDGTNADSRRLTANFTARKFHDISSIIFGGFNLVFFLTWLIFKSGAEFDKTLPRYLEKNPGESLPLSFYGKLDLAISWVFVNSSPPVNFLFHALFAITAFFTSPFFTSLHLLLLFNISTTAKYVIRSATAHINQLLITFVLAIFTIWVFATFNANRYSGSFDVQDGDGNAIDVCSNMWRCLIYNLNFGLRNGGGIADSHITYAFGGVGNVNDNIFEGADFETGRSVVGKMVFDLLFFIVINVIYLNIVFGIIIDTFGEMRGELNERSKFT
jgi:hypothetical protein